MKRIILLAVIIMSSITYSQENEFADFKKENSGFFNITKISYIKAYSIKRERFVEGQGGFFSEPDASSSGANSLQTINGFFLSPSLSVGLGLGLDGYRKPTLNTLPVFLDVRLYLEENGNSLFAFTDIGASVRIGGDTSSLRRGGLFNLGGGYKFSVSRKIDMISEVYFSHKSISRTNEGLRDSNDKLRLNGVGLSIGVMF